MTTTHTYISALRARATLEHIRNEKKILQCWQLLWKKYNPTVIVTSLIIRATPATYFSGFQLWSFSGFISISDFFFMTYFYINRLDKTINCVFISTVIFRLFNFPIVFWISWIFWSESSAFITRSTIWLISSVNISVNRSVTCEVATEYTGSKRVAVLRVRISISAINCSFNLQSFSNSSVSSVSVSSLSDDDDESEKNLNYKVTIWKYLKTSYLSHMSR